MMFFKKPLKVWYFSYRRMSSSEVATALRPFYFSVHPDLFGQYPSERAINESSLQVLSSFIETARMRKPVKETTLTFYLKSRETNENPNILKPVEIRLRDRCLRQIISSILISCNLPTTYVDGLPKQPASEDGVRSRKYVKKYQYEYEVETDRRHWEMDIEFPIRKAQTFPSLSSWLKANVVKAREQNIIYAPVKQEVNRLRNEICDILQLKSMKLDCGWNVSHYRGCLTSFEAMALHHPQEMKVLQGRCVSFGNDTGITVNGTIMLNSGEVRRNWLDFINKIPTEEAVLRRIPSVTKSLSMVLRDIKLVRRKFDLIIMAKEYENRLKRLITSLNDYKGHYGYPNEWPQSLNEYEMVVESEAGPLMVSPTGQFIVPSSGPPSILVNFISENLREAKELNQWYQSNKHIEKELVSKCVEVFRLASLQKDDYITPQMMIECCSNLLKHSGHLVLLYNTHLYISKYYSIMSDGQMFIPWNWKL